jgi:hypothetical protein
MSELLQTILWAVMITGLFSWAIYEDAKKFYKDD